MSAFDIDHHADRLARTQHGVFVRRQIVALGASRHMVSGRFANGRWLEVGRRSTRSPAIRAPGTARS